ncbi:YceI family protein [Dawidia soli]|uniref:YceI family protein n=1 Tax=Dawidia soli TaxID=2782352 RepID=A0AAP2GD90_9BACT|nr:YceI family protein [Dawidia soli]MBT1686992.1 YceI family protein [Dawidia soli]
MRFTILFSISLLLTGSRGFAQQRFVLEQSSISFHSDGVIEDIAATNTNVSSIFDASKGEIAYLLNMKDFQFPKKLMQVHFNEKYVESEKYPRASFEGKIVGFDPAVEGLQQVNAVGRMTIHGVTKDVQFPGTVERKGGMLAMKANFILKLQDYAIKVPQIVWQNIAQQVEVTVDFNYRAQ